MAHSLGPGIISGVVSEDGVPKSGAIISVYDRDTGDLVKRVVCGASGDYIVSGLNPNTDSYYVVAKDDDGAVRKNGLIQDYVQPVNGAVGANWDANWYVALKQLSPVCTLAALDRNSKGEIPNLFLSNSTYADQLLGGFVASGTVTSVAQTTLLGSPSLLQFNMASAILRSYGHSEHASLNRTQNTGWPAQFTMFAVFDTSISTSIFFHGRVNSFKHASLTIAASVIYLDVTYSNVVNATLLSYTIPVGANRSGLHSICGIIDSSAGGICKIYIDGIEVASTTNVTERLPYPFVTATGIANIWDRVDIHAWDHTSTGNGTPTVGSGKVVLSSVFLYALSATQITTLHNSLFTVQPPILTGYAKEVATDYACAYYPLTSTGKPTISDGFRLLAGQTKTIHANTHDLVSTSGALPIIPTACPVAGEAGFNFNGTFCLRSEMEELSAGWYPSGLAMWTYSFETWISLNSTPTAFAYIVNFRTTIPNQVNNVLYATTTRTLSVFTRSTSNDTLNFTPVLNIGEWYHVVVTMDRIIGEAKLYLNGTLSETKTTGLTGTTNSNGTGASGMLVLGGDVDPKTRNISNTLDAKLFGVATYQTVLSPTRIQAHYDARLTA